MPVSTIVMDDAHACVDSIREACVIRVKRGEQAYIDLLDVFASALEQQGAGTFADVKNGEYEALLPVPYWAWQERHGEVVEILSKVAKSPSDPEQKAHSAWFSWPLVKDAIQNCQCVISGQGLEIAPRLAPLELFGTYHNAKHRVFMSATVTNDSFLVKGLRLSPETICKPLVHKNEKWSGEKMILLPSVINPTLDRVAVVNEYGKTVPKRTYGVVALTPSFKMAEFWHKCGATVAKTETIDAEIEKLWRGECESPLVIASRYDGIDLPDHSCRILIFDSLPHASNLIDAYEDNCRASSDITAMRLARIIEQGLGRSVRGEKDYCVIILIGPELVRMVRGYASRKLLSSQTQAQIDIGLEIAEMAQSDVGSATPAIDAIRGLVKQCLKRDPSWKQFYVERMDAVTASTSSSDILSLFERELEAEKKYQTGDPRGAVELMQKLIDDRVKDDAEKGWYLQEMARYAHAYSKTDSNNLQLEAHRKNRYLMRPATGMKIETLQLVTQRRNANIIDWVRTFPNHEELRLVIEDVLGRLAFGVKADRFEEAFHQLGRALGFASQRPEREWKEGPDNLWAVRSGEYLLVECKSEVNLDRAEINKTESGQMNNACAWFNRNYPGAVVTRFMIIPTKKVSKAGGFNEQVLILRKKGLERLVKDTRAFFDEFAGLDLRDISEKKVQQLLDMHHLSIDDVLSHLESVLN